MLLKFRSLNSVEKYVKEVHFTSKNLKTLIYEIQYIQINMSSISISDLCASHSKRKYVNSAEHENSKKRMREHNIVAYPNIVGTPEHEVRKAQMRQTYSIIVGTP